MTSQQNNNNSRYVAVRIRDEDEARGVPLCAWDPQDLGALLELVRLWGLYVPADGSSDGLEFSGQFVLDESEVYFEIIVHRPYVESVVHRPLDDGGPR